MYGDLSSGRQVAAWHGRLSASQRPGPDRARVPGDAGVQFAHEPTEAEPCEGVTPLSVDDHRRSLSGDAARDPADHPGLGHRAIHPEIEELQPRGCPVMPDLSLQKSRSYRNAYLRGLHRNRRYMHRIAPKRIVPLKRHSEETLGNKVLPALRCIPLHRQRLTEGAGARTQDPRLKRPLLYH